MWWVPSPTASTRRSSVCGRGVEGAVGEVLAAVGAGACVHELVGGAFPGGAAVGFAGEFGAQGAERLAGVADGCGAGGGLGDVAGAGGRGVGLLAGAVAVGGVCLGVEEGHADVGAFVVQAAQQSVQVVQIPSVVVDRGTAVAGHGGEVALFEQQADDGGGFTAQGAAVAGAAGRTAPAVVAGRTAPARPLVAVVVAPVLAAAVAGVRCSCPCCCRLSCRSLFRCSCRCGPWGPPGSGGGPGPVRPRVSIAHSP